MNDDPDRGSPLDVLKGVARAHSVTLDDLTGPRQTKWVVTARKAGAAALETTFPEMSLADIGRFLGGKDHTTVLYYLGRRVRA